MLGLCLPRGGADKPLPGGEGWHGASQPAAWPPRCCHPATSARCCPQAPGADSHPCVVWGGGTWDAGNKSRQHCGLLGRSGCGFCPKRYRAGAAPCQEQQVPGARRVHAALHPKHLLPPKKRPEHTTAPQPAPKLPPGAVSSSAPRHTTRMGQLAQAKPAKVAGLEPHTRQGYI